MAFYFKKNYDGRLFTFLQKWYELHRNSKGIFLSKSWYFFILFLGARLAAHSQLIPTVLSVFRYCL